MKIKILKVFVIIFAIIGASVVGRIVKEEHTYIQKEFF